MKVVEPDPSFCLINSKYKAEFHLLVPEALTRWPSFQDALASNEDWTDGTGIKCVGARLGSRLPDLREGRGIRAP